MRIIHSLINLPPTNLLAFAMVIPTYIIFFIGTDPLIQGLAFSLYLMPLGSSLIKKRMVLPPSKLMIFLAVFMSAWIIPSVYVAFNDRINSDLVRLPILFFHASVLTILLITFHHYLSKAKGVKSLQKLTNYIFFILIPLVVLIYLKVLYIKYVQALPERPHPFNVHPSIAAEIVFIFFLMATQIKDTCLKITALVLSIIFFYIIGSRSALIAGYLFFLVAYIYPWVRNVLRVNPKFVVLMFAILTIVIFVFYQNLLTLINSLLMLSRDTYGVAGRLEMWLVGINSIKDFPLSGVGFWTHPTPSGYNIPSDYSIYTSIKQPSLEIHNAFIRIATENGAVLTSIIVACICYAIYRLHQLKLYSDLAVVVSIIFYLCFVTRHLTLNLLNIIFYAYICKAMLLPKPSWRNDKKNA